MIIPIKCFTCGKVIADKYRFYIEQVVLYKTQNKIDVHETNYLEKHNDLGKSIEGQLMDSLNITRMCCRRHFLTHVDHIS
jgi:DNA-directed RNA polymerase I, II, and III subunit RPABC5